MSGFCGSGKGEGFSIGHAGELLQGALWRDSMLEPFLVTLPAPPFQSRATVCRTAGQADCVQPAWKNKALRAARLAWNKCDGGAGAVELVIESSMPVGRGCGSSTSDCVAAIRAVANLLGRPVTTVEIAEWTATAETASDATMFELQPVAFSPRRGKVLRGLGEAYPAMRIVAADLGGPAVDTVARGLPLYSVCESAKFAELLGHLEQSIQKQDASGLAKVASASAAVHQRYFPHPRWNEFVATAQRAGALGVACAHSGSLAVALLDQHARGEEQTLAANLERLAYPVLARYSLEESLCRSS